MPVAPQNGGALAPGALASLRSPARDPLARVMLDSTHIFGFGNGTQGQETGETGRKEMAAEEMAADGGA